MESSLSSIQRIRPETGLPVRFYFWFSILSQKRFCGATPVGKKASANFMVLRVTRRPGTTLYGKVALPLSSRPERRDLWFPASSTGRGEDLLAAITIWHYFKSARCYTRSLANSTRDGMLSLSGNSLKSVSILSGEGLDCGTRGLPLFSLNTPSIRVFMGFSLRENQTYVFSPVGTADLSPGRSPGLSLIRSYSPVGTAENGPRRSP